MMTQNTSTSLPLWNNECLLLVLREHASSSDSGTKALQITIVIVIIQWKNKYSFKMVNDQPLERVFISFSSSGNRQLVNRDLLISYI